MNCRLPRRIPALIFRIIPLNSAFPIKSYAKFTLAMIMNVVGVVAFDCLSRSIAPTV
jgi:hypothetical protein